jgi:hypothetical protein
MTAEQVQRAARRVGPLYEIPKKQQGEQHPRWLIAKFLTDLANTKRVRSKLEIESEPQVHAAYRRRYGSEPISHEKTQALYRHEADRAERLIWEMQQKRGCKIDPAEAVARDAERQGDVPQEAIDRLRGRRRPKIR